MAEKFICFENIEEWERRGRPNNGLIKLHDSNETLEGFTLFKYAGENWQKPIPQLEPLQTFTFDELVQMELEPPQFLIEEILPRGICLLGAPPKTGKSWLSLDIGIQIAQGGEVLGKNCNQAEVLYLALEDSLYRVMDRIKKQQPGGNVPGGLHIAIMSEQITVGDQETGLYKQLDMFLEKYPNTGLVIIDTLQMVKPQGGNKQEYEQVYSLLNTIRPLFTERGIGVILIHHTRKATKNDINVFETFLGTQALTGGTDAMYIIQKAKDEDYHILFGRGRDIEDFEICIKMDNNCRWKSYGSYEDAAEFQRKQNYRDNPIVRAIKKLLEESDIGAIEVKSKDLRMYIMENYRETVGTSEKNFMKLVTDMDFDLMQYDGIKHTPLGNTTRNGVSGSYHRFEYTSNKNNKN